MDRASMPKIAQPPHAMPFHVSSSLHRGPAGMTEMLGVLSHPVYVVLGMELGKHSNDQAVRTRACVSCMSVRVSCMCVCRCRGHRKTWGVFYHPFSCCQRQNLSPKWKHPFGWTGQLACSWDPSILTRKAGITGMGSHAKHFFLCGCWGFKLMS